MQEKSASHLYRRMCQSVGRSVSQLIRNAFVTVAGHYMMHDEDAYSVLYTALFRFFFFTSLRLRIWTGSTVACWRTIRTTFFSARNIVSHHDFPVVRSTIAASAYQPFAESERYLFPGFLVAICFRSNEAPAWISSGLAWL